MPRTLALVSALAFALVTTPALAKDHEGDAGREVWKQNEKSLGKVGKLGTPSNSESVKNGLKHDGETASHPRQKTKGDASDEAKADARAAAKAKGAEEKASRKDGAGE